MAITIYASNKWLDKGFGATNYTPPGTMYLGLSTTTISASGTNSTEPGSGSYVRKSVTNDKNEFSTAAGGALTNKNDIEFQESSGSWGTITDVAFWDHAESGSGNVWYFQQLSSSKVVQAQTTVTFSASSLNITMTN